MLKKLRRNSKQQATTTTTATTAPSPTTSTLSPQKDPTTFHTLPPELRTQILTLAATSSPTLHLFHPTLTPHPPALLLTSRQTHAESRSLLLSRAPVRAHITDYDFRPLVRWIGSLYPSELRALRANGGLVVALRLTGRGAGREGMVGLRRWAVRRAGGLDRLGWGYVVVLDGERRGWEKRAVELEAHWSAVRELGESVHESLEFEVQPVLEAVGEALRGCCKRMGRGG